MTDEEIKQNALKCADDFIADATFKRYMRDTYIAGAHSRDEEIKELKEEIESLKEQYNSCFDGFSKRGTKLKELLKENVKLSNPLISVKDRLPEESRKHMGRLSDTVFVITDKGDGTSARYDWSTKTWCPAKILQGHITNWMPIPQIKKGE